MIDIDQSARRILVHSVFQAPRFCAFKRSRQRQVTGTRVRWPLQAVHVWAFEAARLAPCSKRGSEAALVPRHAARSGDARTDRACNRVAETYLTVVRSRNVAPLLPGACRAQLPLAASHGVRPASLARRPQRKHEATAQRFTRRPGNYPRRAWVQSCDLPSSALRVDSRTPRASRCLRDAKLGLRKTLRLRPAVDGRDTGRERRARQRRREMASQDHVAIRRDGRHRLRGS